MLIGKGEKSAMNTIYQMIQHMNHDYGERIAFQYCEEKKVCAVKYSDFVKDIKKCAGFLMKIFPDIEGKHIGICAGSCYQYMVHFMAILLVKGVVVPLNPSETTDVLQYEIDFSDIIGIFLDEDSMGLGLNMKHIRKMTFHEYQSFQKEYAVDDGASKDRIGLLVFTSGTTGKNKGVMLSQSNIFTAIETYTGQLKILERNMKGDVLRAFVIVPMYHVSGIFLVLPGIMKGITLNICEDPKYLYRELKLMKSDCISVMPTILKSFYRDLIRNKKERLGDIGSICCSGAIVESDMLNEFRKNGITIIQAYALTESCGNGTVNTYEDERKLKSVGTPGAGCEIKIENDEILLKGSAIMLGYYKNEKETNKVLQDGWLHTGDLGYLDEDGYLYLTGRKKNLIILSGGENVSPEELEGEILRCEKVYEVLVREENDKICASIYCESVNEEEIKEYISNINRTLPYYKRITKVKFAGEPLEKTATGKIKR